MINFNKSHSNVGPHCKRVSGNVYTKIINYISYINGIQQTAVSWLYRSWGSTVSPTVNDYVGANCWSLIEHLSVVLTEL